MEYPEKWESPKWEMPLTIPLIDQIFSVSDISTEDNQIEIDTLNQTFIINADAVLLDKGEIQIEESFFFVPGTDAVTNEVSFEIPNEGIESPPPTIMGFVVKFNFFSISFILNPSIVPSLMSYQT